MFERHRLAALPQPVSAVIGGRLAQKCRSCAETKLQVVVLAGSLWSFDCGTSFRVIPPHLDACYTPPCGSGNHWQEDLLSGVKS